MPLDMSIYNALLQKPKSVQEYDAEAMQGQSNALALQQGRMKMDEYTRSVSDGNKLRQVVAGFGADQTANYNALLGAGRLDEAQKYQKNIADTGKVNADAKESGAKTAKSEQEVGARAFDSIAQTMGALSGVPGGASRAHVANALQHLADLGVIKPEMVQKVAMSAPDDPALMPQWLATQRTAAMSAKEQMAYVAPDANATLQAKTSIATNKATNDRVASEGAANRGLSDRHFNATEARAKESAGAGAGQGKAPTGYRWTASGDLEAIPGGPGSKGATSTEGERKAATLLMRLQGSEKQLENALRDDPKAAKPGIGATMLRGVGGESLANSVAVGEPRQRVEAAQLDILDAALTLGTGAAYTKEQLEGYRKSYFPQIGDKDKTIADKKVRLANVIDAAKIAAGRSGPAVDKPVNAPAGGVPDDIAKLLSKHGGK